jgi:serine/threonine protein kinase/tetratricopeptide (TPR) repeat protein
MTHDNSLRAIFSAALDRPDATERARFLDEACGADASLRERVEKLLCAHDEAGGFFSQPSKAPSSSQPGSRTVAFVTEKAGDSIGRYKLLQQIGEGGCGVVYMAAQEEPIRRRVALKIIKLGMDTKSVIARFEAERQALALMDHPNIAKVLDAGATDTGRPYFVMELVKGIRITDYCDQNNVPTSARLELFSQVCHAIQHAHQKGIIHRDIKPSNILVTLHDGVPVPKVIDFGIAKATSNQRLTDKTIFTAFEQFIGTPAYMSPEQAEMSGLDIDTRSDIYALGVLLYELLTGQTPFEARELLQAGLDEMRRTIREQEPARPSTRLSTMLAADLTIVAGHRQCESGKLTSSIRGDLDWIVMKALEKDRTRRYDTANGLAMDIARHLNNEPVVARPPTNLYRFQKLVRRNKLAFAAASAVLVALILGLGVSTWMFFKEKAVRQRAVAAENKAQTEASKSQQVARFLQEMLKGVGPSVALGRDTKMLQEILDKTAERIGKDLKNQPGVEAELRNTIGQVYLALGGYEKAGAMHREALAMRRKLLGKEHVDVAESLNNLAVVFERQGKPVEAEPMHREALAMQRKLLGNEHPAVADSLDNLANALYRQGKLTEAEATHREALAMRRKLFGNEHPDVAYSLNNLANVLGSQGKLAEAETLYRETLAMQRKLLGSEDPSIAVSLENLGNVLLCQHKLGEAETTRREGLAMQRKFLGSEHPDLARSLHNLADVLFYEKKLTESETLYREALAMKRKLSGNENLSVAASLHNLADVVRKGNPAEAESLYREALAMKRKLLGKENLSVAASLHNLADVVRKGNPAEAETLYREALAIRMKLLDNENQIAGSRHQLFTLLVDQGKSAEAESLSRGALADARARLTNDLPQLEGRIHDLADVLYRQAKYAEAEPLYREHLQSELTHGDATDDKIVGTAASLGRLLADWAWAERVSKSEIANPKSETAERAREAERLLRNCLDIRLRGTNSTDSRVGDTRSRLGGALLAVAVTDAALTAEARQTKLTEAESLLLGGNESLQQSRSVDSKYSRNALERLVHLYEAWGKPDKLDDWKQKLAEFDKGEIEKPAAVPKP